MKILKIFLKLIIGTIGFTSVFIAIKELFPVGLIQNNKNLDTLISALICIAAFILFYIMSSILIKNLSKITDKIDVFLKEKNYTSYEFILGILGFITGLIVANLICIPVLGIKFVGIPITLMVNLVFAYLGLMLAIRFKSDKFFINLKQKYDDESKEKNNSKLLDTSVIIDGRIFDILLSGFIEGKLIIPQFIIDELGTLADSEDTAKRAKGRNGLNLVANMQKEFDKNIVIEDIKDSASIGADELLIEVAVEKGLVIVTNDFNLNKIATIKNIKVLNINELSNALKPLANVGDEITVTISKQGKERMQGIGYLEGGTMAVIENTKDKVGETVTAIVTSVIQTQAGRMIFGNIIEG